MNEYARYEDEDDGMGAGTMAALLAAGSVATPVGRPIRKLIGKGANKVAPKLAGKAQDAMRKAANAKMFDPLKGGAMSRAAAAGRDATAGMGGNNWADTLGNIQATGVAPWAAAKSLYKDARAGLGGKVPEAPMQSTPLQLESIIPPRGAKPPEPTSGETIILGSDTGRTNIVPHVVVPQGALTSGLPSSARVEKSGIQWKPDADVSYNIPIGGTLNTDVPDFIKQSPTPPTSGAKVTKIKTEVPPSVRANGPDELDLINMVGMSGKPRGTLMRKNISSHNNGTMKGQAKPMKALQGAMDDPTLLTAAQIEALDPTFAAGVEKLRQAGVSPQRINLIMRMGDTLSRDKGGNKTRYQTAEQMNSFIGKALTGRKP